MDSISFGVQVAGEKVNLEDGVDVGEYSEEAYSESVSGE
jgi:hypothetical protein